MKAEILLGLMALIFRRIQHRIGVVFVFIVSMSLAIRYYWGFSGESTVLSLVLSFYFLFGVLCNTQAIDGGGFSGVSRYFFRLPIRSRDIVGAHILLALLVILAAYALWFLLVLRVMPRSVLHVDMILYLLASFSLFSAVVWGLNRVPKIRIVLLGAGFFLIFGMSLLPLGIVSESETWWLSRRFLILAGLVLVIFAGPLLAVPLVDLDRSGWVDWSLARWNPAYWWANCRRFIWRSSGSARRALVLRELVQSGWMLPVGMLGVVGIMHVSSAWWYYLSGTVQNEYIATLSSGLLVGALWMGALFQGLMLSNCSKSVLNEDRRMFVHTAVLPISSAEVVISKLWAAAISLALGWLELLVGMLGWYWIWDVPPIWVVLENEMSSLIEPGMVPSLAVLTMFAVAVSWRSMMMLFTFGMSDRKYAVILGFAAAILQTFVLSTIATWWVRPVSDDLRLVVLAVVWSWLGFKILLTIFSVSRTVRGGAGVGGIFVFSGVAWLLVTFFGYLQLEWLGAFLSCPRSVLLPGLLVLMPLASTSLAARVVASNRHAA